MLQTAGGYNGGRKSVTPEKAGVKYYHIGVNLARTFCFMAKNSYPIKFDFCVSNRRFHLAYELQLHRFSFSSGQFAVIQSANSTAPITAISRDDILPSDEKARNITSKNKYQLSSNIICSYDFFSQYAMRKNKVTKFSLEKESYNQRMEILLDENTANLVKTYIPRNAVLYELSEFFSVCSDATRTKIICALSISEMCVTDLCSLLSLNQTTCSHQLKYLKSAGIVAMRREGKIIFYSLKNKKIEDVLLAGVEFLKMGD